MYVILIKNGYADLLVSMNDSLYAEYIMSGYTVLVQGTKKRLMKMIDELQ